MGEDKLNSTQGQDMQTEKKYAEGNGESNKSMGANNSGATGSSKVESGNNSKKTSDTKKKNKRR